MDQRRGTDYVSRGSEYYRPGAQFKSSSATEPAPSKRRVFRPGRRIVRGVWLVAGLIVLGLVTTLVLTIQSSKSPLPAPLAKQITFSAYLPDDSRGVLIDQASYTWQEGVLTYQVKTTDGHHVFVSEQTLPKSFDMTSFLQHIKSKQTVGNSYGQGQAGVSENNLVISQIVGDTWIFMSGPINMEPTQISAVFASLHKY